MDDLSDLGSVIETLRRIAVNPEVYQRGIENANAQFLSTLDSVCDEQALAPVHTTAMRKSGTPLGVVLAPQTVAEALQRLQPLLGLNNRQMRAIRGMRIIDAQPDGTPRFRVGQGIVLPVERARLYLVLIGGLALLTLVTYLSDAASLLAMLRSFGLSIAIGSTGGFVLERSFRLYPVLEKLQSIEPWLSPG